MQSEHGYDKTVEETFPASDAPANSGIAGPKGNDKPAPAQKPTGTPTSDREKIKTNPQD
jgi:hypothetical protein